MSHNVLQSQASWWLSALFPQWDDPGTVSTGADPADHPAQLTEKQAHRGRACLQKPHCLLWRRLWPLRPHVFITRQEAVRKEENTRVKENVKSCVWSKLWFQCFVTRGAEENTRRRREEQRWFPVQRQRAPWQSIGCSGIWRTCQRLDPVVWPHGRRDEASGDDIATPGRTGPLQHSSSTSARNTPSHRRTNVIFIISCI